MSCGKWTNGILGLVILAVTIWPTMFSVMANKWIVVIAAILVILHACFCSYCVSGSAKMSTRKRR